MGKRNGLIDFYRFIFSLVIVFHHAMWLDGVVDISTQVVFLGGYSAVEFFFIVSGLFLAKKAYSCQESNEVGKRTWHEIINRIKTLYPAFLVAFIISFGLKHHFSGGNIFEMLTSSIGELMLLLGAGFNFGNGIYIGPIWYLSDLLIVILMLFPIMIKFKRFFSSIIAPLIVILGYGYLAMTTNQLTDTINQVGIICGGILRGCCGVALGNIIYYLTLRRKIKFTKIGKILLRLLEVSGLFSVLYCMNRYNGDYYDYIEVVLFAILVLLAFKYEQNTFFNNKIIYLLGEYSGTLYVVHTCLLQIPHYIWPNTWRMQYFMWMLMTNVVSILVFAFVKLLFPIIKQTVINTLICRDGESAC